MIAKHVDISMIFDGTLTNGPSADSSAWRIRSCALEYHTCVRLYRLACETNLEGIVAKHRAGLYDTRKPLWVKFKNPAYTQAEGREELFEGLRT
jgi:hypothetical protein